MQFKEQRSQLLLRRQDGANNIVKAAVLVGITEGGVENPGAMLFDESRC